MGMHQGGQGARHLLLLCGWGQARQDGGLQPAPSGKGREGLLLGKQSLLAAEHVVSRQIC